MEGTIFVEDIMSVIHEDDHLILIVAYLVSEEPPLYFLCRHFEGEIFVFVFSKNLKVEYAARALAILAISQLV